MTSNRDKDTQAWVRLAAENSAYPKYLKDLGGASSIQKWTESLTASGSVSRYLKDIEATSSLSKWTDSLAASGSIAKYLKDHEAASSLGKWTESLTASGSIAKYLKDFEATSSLSKWIEPLTASSSLTKYLKELQGASSLQKWADSVASASHFARYVRDIEESNSLHKWTESIVSSSAFNESFERLKRADYLDSLLEEIEKEASAPSVSIDTEFAAADAYGVEELLQELASADSPTGFSKVLEKAPRILKWLLLTVLLGLVWQLLVGAASGVIGNLVTPHVQAYLEEAKATTQREQIKGIKKLSFAELGVELRDYRFITATTLIVRATPNARAPIVGELKLGQVVSVQSTDRDWTEVVYEYGDGSTIAGWVFTRYTAKFRS